ncbi:MAG: hypothetical protein ACRDK9_02305 [Solirubrobacterales bacterium]
MQRVFGSILVAALAGAALVVLTSDAGAARAKTLGKTKRAPAPECPRSPCEAVGRTTGFQLTADGKRAPFKARESGSLVAWAIEVSKPRESQRSFFGEFYESTQFGTAPTARIAVIKRSGDGRRYKLKGQGPTIDLTSSLGSRQVFTLTDPLRIRKGDFLALTIPTWAPSFAVDLAGRDNRWRSSRADGACRSREDIRRGKPQQNVGSQREYGCDYSGARLLYWGYYVARGGGGGGGEGGGGGGGGN